MDGMEILKPMLQRAVDYAGLFPPAGLPLDQALDRYRSYARSRAEWLLGRFVVPAARLPEVGTWLRNGREGDGSVVPLSVLLETDTARRRADLARLQEFVAAGHPARVEALEGPAEAVLDAEVAGWARAHVVRRYAELPAGAGEGRLAAVREAGACAKVRTGGVRAEQFPSVQALAAFVGAAVAAGVAFKATAGLHHAWAGDYPLTYAPESARGAMVGFLNLVLAVALAREGHVSFVAPMLAERALQTIVWHDGGVAYRGVFLPATCLAATRETAFHGFGSCSFGEPVADLEALGR